MRHINLSDAKTADGRILVTISGEIPINIGWVSSNPDFHNYLYFYDYNNDTNIKTFQFAVADHAAGTDLIQNLFQSYLPYNFTVSNINMNFDTRDLSIPAPAPAPAAGNMEPAQDILLDADTVKKYQITFYYIPGLVNYLVDKYKLIQAGFNNDTNEITMYQNFTKKQFDSMISDAFGLFPQSKISKTEIFDITTTETQAAPGDLITPGSKYVVFDDQAGATTDQAGATTDQAGATTDQAGATTDQAGGITSEPRPIQTSTALDIKSFTILAILGIGYLFLGDKKK